MNYLKETTLGIDDPIQRLQTYLYDSLVERWGFTDFNGYGRVYKNKRNDLVVPEYYASNREYKEVLLDDRINGIMFFSPSDTIDIFGSLMTQECDIIFSFNLKDIGVSNEREDEKIRQFILFTLNNYKGKKEIRQTVTGLNNVYIDYNGVADYFYDMQDFHHFKIKVLLRYINKNCI